MRGRRRGRRLFRGEIEEADGPRLGQRHCQPLWALGAGPGRLLGPRLMHAARVPTIPRPSGAQINLGSGVSALPTSAMTITDSVTDLEAGASVAAIAPAGRTMISVLSARLQWIVKGAKYAGAQFTDKRSREFERCRSESAQRPPGCWFHPP